MNDAPGWPSKRFVIAVVIATLACAAWVIVPDLTLRFRDPAEAEYRKGWTPRAEMQPIPLVIDSWDQRKAELHFRKAFALKPNVLRYQLSLVQVLSDDLDGLRGLLRDKRLLPQARAMAEYRLALALVGQIRSDQDERARTNRPAALRHLERARKLDPDNAAPCYGQALIYYLLGEDAEGASALAEGNRRRRLREYSYADPVFDRTSAAFMLLVEDHRPENDARRQLAKYQALYANSLSRQGKSDQARQALEDVIALARRHALAATYDIGFLVGSAICRTARDPLDRMYEDLNMRPEHDRLEKTSSVFRAGSKEISQSFGKTQAPWLFLFGDNRSFSVLMSLWLFAIAAFAKSFVPMLLAVIIGTKRLMKKEPRDSSKTELPVWREGELVRWVVIPLALLTAVSGSVPLFFRSVFSEFLPLLFGAFAPFAVSSYHSWAGRRVYVAKYGPDSWPKTSGRRQRRKLSPEVHAWWDKRNTLAELAILGFLAWLFVIVVVSCRVTSGSYPWQTGVIGVDFVPAQKAKAARLAAKLPDWPLTSPAPDPK